MSVKRSKIDKKDDLIKGYTQFSKKVVGICLVNLFLIEFFAMGMIIVTQDTSQLSFLITAIAAECLACVVWYMKNSEAEKKARIQAEIEQMKCDHELRLKEVSNDVEDTDNWEAPDYSEDSSSEPFADAKG